jgi:tetratricopeptide (TPR) repeat protein
MFNFFIACLDKYGIPASSLFPSIPLDQLTPEQLESLTLRPFAWSLLPSTRGENILSLVNALVSSRRELERATAALKEMTPKVDQLTAFCGLQMVERWARDEFSSSATMRDHLAAFHEVLTERRNECAPMIIQEGIQQLRDDGTMQNNPFGQWGLASALLKTPRGSDGEFVDREMREVTKRAADGGIAAAQHELALRLKSNGNFDGAAEYFRKAADARNPQSECELGIMLVNGWEGTAPRVEEGERYLERSGRRANRKAMDVHGRRLAESGDNPRLLEWYRQAASQ